MELRNPRGSVRLGRKVTAPLTDLRPEPLVFDGTNDTVPWKLNIDRGWPFKKDRLVVFIRFVSMETLTSVSLHLLKTQ